MAILDMLVKILHSWVKNIGETMFSEILNCNNSKSFSELIIPIQPQRPQLRYRIKFSL